MDCYDRNWAQVYGELSIMYEGRLPEELEDRSRRQEGNRRFLTCLHAAVIYKTRATSLIHKIIALNYHRRILFTEFFSHTRLEAFDARQNTVQD